VILCNEYLRSIEMRPWLISNLSSPYVRFTNLVRFFLFKWENQQSEPKL
jgi:hypothetical protein